jgi:hypothetical protein
MVEDNLTRRDAILPSERAKALIMQYEAITRQGQKGGDGRRTDEIVGERNSMSPKQIQRYIKLNDLVPELLEMLDNRKISFTPALEIAFISHKNQKPPQPTTLSKIIHNTTTYHSGGFVKDGEQCQLTKPPENNH